MLFVFVVTEVIRSFLPCSLNNARYKSTVVAVFVYWKAAGFGSVTTNTGIIAGFRNDVLRRIGLEQRGKLIGRIQPPWDQVIELSLSALRMTPILGN